MFKNSVDEPCSQTHKSKDVLLSLNMKGNIFADQTPTPTRFIKNCEEVGLFQDLQNVNPFEETFKKAAEAVKSGNLLRFPSNQTDDTLHTPNVFPHLTDLNLPITNVHQVETAGIKDLPGVVVDKDAEKIEQCSVADEMDEKFVEDVADEDNDQVKVVIKTGDGKLVQFFAQKLSTPSAVDNNAIYINTTGSGNSSNNLNIKQVLRERLLEFKTKKDTCSKVAIPKLNSHQNHMFKCYAEPRKIRKTSANLNKPKQKRKVDSHLTESEREYLARNRAAAFRCRMKKKTYIQRLEQDNIELKMSNQNLQNSNLALMREIQRLKSLVNNTSIVQNENVNLQIVNCSTVCVDTDNTADLITPNVYDSGLHEVILGHCDEVSEDVSPFSNIVINSSTCKITNNGLEGNTKIIREHSYFESQKFC